MYEIVIGTRSNGTARTLTGAHMLGKLHSEVDANGQYVRVHPVGDRATVLGEYLNGRTLIKLTD